MKQINSMSYCQKHKNHHCVHAHNCKDPNHKKKNHRNNSSASKHKQNHLHKKYQPPMGTIQDNQQCLFAYQKNTHQINLNNQGYIKAITSLTQQLEETKRKLINTQIENRELKQKNSHVECQIQYLRSQLDLLVNNHNTDIAKQIKRNLIQHTELSIKIKQLTSALFDKEKFAEQLSSENYSLLRKNKQLQNSIKSQQDKIKLIASKNQQLSSVSTSSKNKIKELQTELRSLKDKYNTLTSAADKSSKLAENYSDQFNQTKEKLQKLQKSKESQNRRIKELHEVQKKAWQKMIQDLKQQINKKSQENNQLKQNLKKASQQHSELKQDFEHAKNMVLRYEKLNSESQKVQQIITKNKDKSQQNMVSQQKKTVPKINMKQKPDKQFLLKIEELQKQKALLEQKIQQLQKQFQHKQSSQIRVIGQRHKDENKTVIINEELILSIGASEQFKRILEQKNATIKKLMREKADLYNQIYQQACR